MNRQRKTRKVGSRRRASARTRPDAVGEDHLETSFDAAIGVNTAALVVALCDLLGARLVAYLGGATQMSAVRQWALGERAIACNIDVYRLWVAYQVASVITARNSEQVAQAWFQGRNPQLDDCSPARVLRDGDLEEAGPRVLSAAQQFAGVG